MHPSYRVRTESGNSWTTAMNCTLDEAREYFLGRYRLTYVGGKRVETQDKIVSVDLVEPTKEGKHV